jgi:hypothetical protein
VERVWNDPGWVWSLRSHQGTPEPPGHTCLSLLNKVSFEDGPLNFVLVVLCEQAVLTQLSTSC